MKKIWILIMILGILFACTKQDSPEGKQKAPAAKAEKKIQIVATIGMIADAVKGIGGDRVQVTALMGPGIDPHLYKASAGDVRRMTKADMIFYCGLHLEGKMTEVFEQMSRNRKTVAVAEQIDKSLLLSHEDYKGLHDPHIWFDVKLWTKAVERIGQELADFDKPNAAMYKSNLTKYIEDMKQLDQYIRSKASELAPEKRVLITAHDAFKYFGKAYGFDVRGIQGISTTAEAGTADVDRLAEFIKARQIPAIFVETSVPERYVEALQSAVKAKGFEVSIGGHLFSDSMGDAGTKQGTYLGMLRHNIDTIVNGLKK